MPASPFNVLFLGAGVINFGGPVQPWNHSERLETKLEARLRVVGIIDIDTAKAKTAIEMKRTKAAVNSYEMTEVFNTIAEASAALTGENVPHLAVIGITPNARGSTAPGRNAELQLIEYFPKIALFIEKPLSSDTAEEATKVASTLRESGNVTSVGYMLRYLKTVRAMKDLIADNNLSVMATSTRYLFPYRFAGNNVSRLFVWDKSINQGPIVEQATHVCDLSRFFAPSVILDSVQVHTIEHTDEAGKLGELKIDESVIAPENRVSRLTNAMWRYDNGATGSLLHGFCLHDGEYDVEFMVFADGWTLRLVDPYNINPKLYVRRPGHVEEEIKLGEDDCYLGEFSTLIDVIDGKTDRSAILSSYDDALESYKLTWKIRLTAEANYRNRMSAS